MAKIFVSYSRKNIDFAKRLTGVLQKREMDFWVDWEGIPPTVDWMQQIQKGIEEADTFLFIISPDSIKSKVCKEELGIAVKNGKRLIPVVAHEIPWDAAPAELSHLNYIFFRESDDFDVALDKLLTAINTDYGWTQAHRRLQVKALEWERSDKDNGFLLRGKDLADAEQQISINANKDPHPTDIQREYVLKSRQETERQRKISRNFVAALIIVLLGIIGLLAKPSVENAIAKAQAQNQSSMVPVPAGRIDLHVGEKSKNIDVQKFQIEMQPVSNKVYDLCVNVDKCTPPIGSTTATGSSKPDDPVVWLTILQAATYCDWIGRRLPTAAEWELAAQLFYESSQSANRLSLREVWEWTSSYQVDSSQAVSDDWNGRPHNLIFDWSFIQQSGLVNSSNNLEIYKNTSGALGVNADLGFRCAQAD